jgi:chromosome segregation ATPase
MFKKLINNAKGNLNNLKIAANKSDSDKTTPNSKQNQPANQDQLQELPDRPFEIDFDQLYEYEYEDLQDFIQQYDQYSTSIRNKYNDTIGEFRMTKEKLILLEQERKRLLIENEQYKTQNDQLKSFINQQTLNTQNTQNSADSPRSKTSSPKTKQSIQKQSSSVNEDQGTDDELVTTLKSRVLKLVEELTKAEEPICVNVIGLMANFQQSPQSNTAEDHHQQIMNTEDYANNGSEEGSVGRALDTDNNEPLDSERIPEESKEGGNSKNMEQALKEALKDSLGLALRRIGGEIQNISDAYVEAIGKVKQKEKELAEVAQQEAQNEELEQEIEELKAQITQERANLNETKAELDSKSKSLEKAKKAYEEVSLSLQEERVHFRENLDKKQKEIQELNSHIDELKEELQEFEKNQEDLENERDELLRQLEDIERVGAVKERTEKDMGQDLQRVQKSLQTLEEEKKKYEKKVQQAEADRLDKENALIQEKLKHHQTVSDLTKMKEKFEEVEKHLNDEVEGRKVDIRKGDELKKKLLEFERKSKEYKKTIKKLSQQILDLHHQRNEKVEEEIATPELAKGVSELDVPENIEAEVATPHDGGAEKAEIINAQYTKIHQLEEKLEELHQEVQSLQTNNEKLQSDNKDLTKQVKVLTEKRELGLKEINKLTQLLEQARTGGSSPVQSVSSLNFISSRADTSMKTQPNTAVVNNRSALSPGDLGKLKTIKKSLDSVYMKIIMAVTDEKMHESDKKPTGKLGELVKGPLPAENWMKIEKKMNDSIVNLQEYIENFE